MRLKKEIPQKTATNEKEKSALSPIQCTVSQVIRKTTRTAPQIASATTLFSRSCPQRLPDVCRPQKNAPGTEMCLQCSLMHILRPKTNHSTKSHQIVWEGWESVSSKETMLINEVEFCLKVVVLLVRPGTYWVMCYKNGFGI